MSAVDPPQPVPDAAVVVPGVALGVVTSNADPRGRGRLMVSFSTPSGTVEGWAPVMRPWVRPDDGPPVPPEPGDTVVLGFEHGDVRHPVVLGGLVPAAE